MAKITVNEVGLVKVDGVPVCQRVRTPDGIKLVIKDKANCVRTRARGTREVEVTLREFVTAVSGYERDGI